MKHRKPATTECPDCRGAHESVAVMNQNRHGEPMRGIERRPVECETCGSTGRVTVRKRVCCCSGPADERCDGCANAFGLIHVCLVPTDEEIDHELKLAMMPTPPKARPVSPETAALLGAIGDKGNGPRAPR